VSIGSEITAKPAIYVHPHALVESEDIGPGTRVWAFAHIMPGARVGAHCNICDHAFIETGAVVGNRVTVKNGVAIWDRVTIEDGVFLGPNCALTNDHNPRTSWRKTRDELAPTLICTEATVGANATIICGLRIGRGAFIGAGAVVTHSVPDFALVVGNPAHQVGWMCLCAHKLNMPVSTFHGASVSCDKCGRVYTKNEAGLALSELPPFHPEEEP
jgi:UDP-2-acetamido-3-amino-2,3-dideoxy-glucuronate N-acetyltransferase